MFSLPTDPRPDTKSSVQSNVGMDLILGISNPSSKEC